MKNKSNEIISYIKWRINTGVYEPSSKLPSENAFAIKFDCSRLTARKALQILKDEGVLVSRKGRGYFVSLGQHKKEYQPIHGKKGEKDSIQLTTTLPTLSDISCFKSMDIDIEHQQHKHKFSFMKTQFDEDGVPYTVLHSFVNTDLIKEHITLDDVKDSFSRFLLDKNITVKKRIERVIVINAPQAISLKLNIWDQQLVVAAYSVMFDKDGEIIEFAIRYTIPSEYAVLFEKKY